MMTHELFPRPFPKLYPVLYTQVASLLSWSRVNWGQPVMSVFLFLDHRNFLHYSAMVCTFLAIMEPNAYENSVYSFNISYWIKNIFCTTVKDRLMRVYEYVIAAGVVLGMDMAFQHWFSGRKYCLFLLWCLAIL